MVSENLTEFKGRPVRDWASDDDSFDFKRFVPRVRIDYDEGSEGVTIVQKIGGLLELAGAEQIQSLVIGSWQGDDTSVDSSDLVEALVTSAPRLPNLRNLFIGDIIGEECEVSWIMQSDLSSLMAAYPKLESLTVRGGGNLSFGTLSHSGLKSLILQSGGLAPSVIHEISAANLPNLEHLELWLGIPNYGGDATVEDLAPILRGNQFPKLRYLGLKNSAIQDEIAGVAALAPIVNQLEVLDLSLGELGDDGGKALLASPAIRKLKLLDLHFHYMSDAMVKQLEALGNVDVSEQEGAPEGNPADDRYVSLSE